jgi:transglutaminase-like putative cysteine protease
LGNDLIVMLDRPRTNSQATREVRYRVELVHADPAKAFATGVTQAVRSVDPHTAEVTVRSLRPGSLPREAMPAAPVAKEYTTANSMLQIDDPRVKAMAREAQGKLTSAPQVASALERYVNRAMTKKNFKQAFATAAEVAESRKGVLSKHALLVAALARACQIPSRVAIGLVYVDGAEGFGYHMWTEMYLEGCWVPMDAVLGQGGTSAAYLKLTDASLDGPAAYSSFLSVAQVVGQLKISVLAAE